MTFFICGTLFILYTNNWTLLRTHLVLGFFHIFFAYIDINISSCWFHIRVMFVLHDVDYVSNNTWMLLFQYSLLLVVLYVTQVVKDI